MNSNYCQTNYNFQYAFMNRLNCVEQNNKLFDSDIQFACNQPLPATQKNKQTKEENNNTSNSQKQKIFKTFNSSDIYAQCVTCQI